MTRLVFHPTRTTIPAKPARGAIHVWLYGRSPPYAHVGCVGSDALEVASRFRVRPSVAVIDFLSIAMAVTAADTFVMRDDAQDAWGRSLEIVLPLAEPARWRRLKPQLESTLLFLSGDKWTFDFRPKGVRPPPDDLIRRRLRAFDLSKVDCVSLFSGGLDSAIGALDLLATKRRPLFVSHSPQGDAKYQNQVARHLPAECQRMSVNTYPTRHGTSDDSMRTRSFQFLALGALACQAIATFRNLKSVDLFVCENGFIALNPPLTPRRIGSHSTRTAHPNFLDGIHQLWSAAGVPAHVRTPYEYGTKGEMILAHAEAPGLAEFAASTVSCGKWKRRNQQCGRCVPCLIRRAALHAAGVEDETAYEAHDLASVLHSENDRDDLIAVQTAILRLRTSDVKRWVLQAGPLPADSKLRNQHFNVASRGINELAAYLQSEGFSFD